MYIISLFICNEQNFNVADMIIAAERKYWVVRKIRADFW